MYHRQRHDAVGRSDLQYLKDRSLTAAAEAVSVASCLYKSYVYRPIIFLTFFTLAGIVVLKLDDLASKTKTVSGHNLNPTPWHQFAPKTFGDESRLGRASKIIKCSYLMCGSSAKPAGPREWYQVEGQARQCPEFFRWIYRDLEPWSKTKISLNHLEATKRLAAFRAVIVDGKLYVEFYYACVQTRAMFTIWGLLQLLKRYPGLVPDVDLMFDCMDKPSIIRNRHKAMPLPLFRYCTTPDHFDIPFPDWSFWGWPETNIEHWDKQFKEIKQASQAVNWTDKFPYAYWKGNPNVGSRYRKPLLQCNDIRKWGAEILRQDWNKEAKAGFKDSNLAHQCKHRFKIYAEGSAWSVSLKYILSCGSTTLLLTPQYQDFFTRGLMPRENYWPIQPTDLCPAIKFAVDWANNNTAMAEEIGKRGQEYMEAMSMDRVYDYMFHLLSEYSMLLDFKPAPTASAYRVCEESVLCFASQMEREFLKSSMASQLATAPFTMPPLDTIQMDSWIQNKTQVLADVENLRQKLTGETQH